MTWSFQIHNQTGREIIAPAAANQYYEGLQAVVTIPGLGIVQLLDIGHRPGGPHYWGVQVSSGQSIGNWFYDGGGLATLTLTENGTYSLNGQGNGHSGQIGGAIPPIVELPAGRPVSLTAYTNAGFLHRVTITINGGQTIQWQGSGEGNKRMGETTITTPADPSGWVKASILLEWSPDQGRNFFRSQVSPVGSFSVYGFNQRTIVAEDARDHDYDDVTVVLNWWNPPPAR